MIASTDEPQAGIPDNASRARTPSRRSRTLRRDIVVCAIALMMVAVATPAQAHDDVGRMLIARARARGLSATRAWQTLLHYRARANGVVRSEADGLSFFFAGPRGKSDPEAELAATIMAFRARPPIVDPARIEETQPAACRFPARFAFLRAALGANAEELPERDCPLFMRWRQGFAATRVTMVYASAYLNSPASMYGHTLLRLSRSTGEGNPLLDYAINFAADVDTENGLLFAIKGLMGGFRGRFYTTPYYMKIQEYSNVESRDLWEYELNFSPAQIQRLIQHAFELRSTHFDYFFFSENCSYFLLELLEAADPSLRLSDRFVGHVIPSDTVRALLSVPGFVRGERGRPSLRAEMIKRKEALNAAEVSVAERLARDGRSAAGALAPLEVARQALVIDAAYDLARFREGMTATPSESFQQRERDLLILRGRTGVAPIATGAIPAVAAPERGHATMRVGVGGGRGSASGGFVDVSLRVAVHDRLDPSPGYVENATLEMLSLKARVFSDTGKLALEQADAVNIVSLSPYEAWSPRSSWKVRLGGSTAHDVGCHDGWRCVVGGAVTGAGFALRAGRRAVLHGFVESEAMGGRAYNPQYRIGVAGSVAANVTLGSLALFEASTRVLQPLVGDDRRRWSLGGGLSLALGRRAQVRLVSETFVRGYNEARGEMMLYF